MDRGAAAAQVTGMLGIGWLNTTYGKKTKASPSCSAAPPVARA